MFKRILPFLAVILLSACAADSGRQVTRTVGEPCHVTCEKCKEKCDCKKNCLCKGCKDGTCSCCTMGSCACEDCKSGACTCCKTGDCTCNKAHADHKQCKCKDKSAAKKAKTPAQSKL